VVARHVILPQTLITADMLTTPAVPAGYGHAWQSYVCYVDEAVAPMTRNEIMEAIGMAKRTLYVYLPVLLEGGAIRVSRRIGRAELYALDRESPIVQCFLKVERELTKPGEASSEEAEELIVS